MLYIPCNFRVEIEDSYGQHIQIIMEIDVKLNKLLGTANLDSHATDKQSQPRPVPYCHAQQTLLCTPLSDIANVAVYPTVMHSKPRSVPYCQT